MELVRVKKYATVYLAAVLSQKVYDMRNHRPRIGIDFDDVIADFNGRFVQYMNEQLGTNYQYHDITHFEFDKMYGVLLPQMLQHLERFCHDPHWHDGIQPIKDAVATCKELAASYELVVVTSRCESLRSITSEWLYAWGLSLQEVHFTNSSSVRFAERRRQKSAVCREVGLRAFVDDALHNATDVASAGIPVILKNRPWNADRTDLDLTNVYPVDNWTEVPARLAQLVR